MQRRNVPNPSIAINNLNYLNLRLYFRTKTVEYHMVHSNNRTIQPCLS